MKKQIENQSVWLLNDLALLAGVLQALILMAWACLQWIQNKNYIVTLITS